LISNAFARLPVVFAQPALLGLDADISLGSVQAGEAIRRGIELAIDEINDRVGVIGRPLELYFKDHRGNPLRGEKSIPKLRPWDTFGTPCCGDRRPPYGGCLHEFKAILETGVIYLDHWAAGTEVVSNRFRPNFVFRVSIHTAVAGGFLVRTALARPHPHRPGSGEQHRLGADQREGHAPDGGGRMSEAGRGFLVPLGNHRFPNARK